MGEMALSKVLGTGEYVTCWLSTGESSGRSPVITSSSDEKLKFVKDKYGVDNIINYKKLPNWLTRH